MDNKQPQTCFLCKDEFLHNRDGRVTTHLVEKHNMSLEDYIILTEHNNVSPICACGLCNERPLFYRGHFQKFALDHNSFEMREKLYVQKCGQPLCPVCKTNPVGFHRGNPKKFCSYICQGKVNGFSKPKTQKTIKAVFRKKYGVSNPMSVPGAKEKWQESLRLHPRAHYEQSEETRLKRSKASLERWLDPVYRAHMKTALKEACNRPEERERRRNFAIEQAKDPSFFQRFFKMGQGFSSKVHIKIREQLKLIEKGFISEQQISRYIVDELNENKKIIIEINGDYIHANPSRYKADDIIRIPGESYTAQEKWERDQKRLSFLRSQGYEVFVIWESDDIEEWKKIIARRCAP